MTLSLLAARFHHVNSADILHPIGKDLLWPLAMRAGFRVIKVKIGDLSFMTLNVPTTDGLNCSLNEQQCLMETMCTAVPESVVWSKSS